jgi:hypothetical protein
LLASTKEEVGKAEERRLVRMQRSTGKGKEPSEMSRRIALLLTAALVAAMMVVSVAPALAAPNEKATGTGTLVLAPQFGSPTAHVNAIQTNAGLKGSFTIEYAVGDPRFPSGGFAKGKVTCLNVVGNTAYITGQITETTGLSPLFDVGEYVQITVQDNGEPGAGSDGLNFSPGLGSDPGCATGPAPITITKGNFVVTDSV